MLFVFDGLMVEVVLCMGGFIVFGDGLYCDVFDVMCVLLIDEVVLFVCGVVMMCEKFVG